MEGIGELVVSFEEKGAREREFLWVLSLYINRMGLEYGPIRENNVFILFRICGHHIVLVK